MKPDPKQIALLAELALRDIKANGHVVNVLDKEDWDLIVPTIREYALNNYPEMKRIIQGIALTTELYNYYKPEDPILRKKYE